MASGQKLLADLLGITNLATQSISSSKIAEEILRNSSEKSGKGLANDDMLHTKESGNRNGSNKIDPWARKAKNGTQREQVDVMIEEASSTSIHSAAHDNFSDTSRCTEVRMLAEMLEEMQSTPDSSVRSQITVSSNGSSERLPTPEPSDFVKSGVFVSSVHKNLGLSTSHYNEKDTTKQQQQQRPLKQEKQQVHSIKGKNDRLEEKKRIEHEQRQQNDFPLLEKNFPPLNQERKEEKASEKKEQEKHSALSGLTQGKENSDVVKIDVPEQGSNDVIVLQYPQGQKKNVIQEKFKERMLNSVPVKKVAIPKIVKQTQVESNVKKTENSSQEKTVSSGPTPAQEAVSYAAVATSAAIAPFLQIQTALENQISSLVSTMNHAQAATEDFKTKTQAQGFKELENKILEILDQRLKPSGIQNDDIGKTDDVANAEQKAPCPSYGRKVAQPKRIHCDESGFDSDLQLIPTRDSGCTRRASSPLDEKYVPSSHVLPLPEPRLWTKGTEPSSKMHTAAPSKSIPVPVNYLDKSTSPDYGYKRYLANAKTQTSSSESSLVSEKSILETPLPRCKIPVPFSRYTPNGEDEDDINRKRVASRHSENGESLLKKILKNQRQLKMPEKENRPPKSSSSKLPTLESRSLGAEREKDFDAGYGKNQGFEDKIVDNIKKQQKPFDEIHKIAPIDRYLVYPLRGQVPNRKEDPKHSVGRPPSYFQENTRPIKSLKGHTANEGRSGNAEVQSGAAHYVAASRILSEIQQRRERLESNLGAVLRQRDEERLYEYLDQHANPRSDERHRIRQSVDTKIKEISSQLQVEAKEDPKPLMQNSMREETRKDIVQKKGFKQFQKGRKERPVDTMQQKILRSKSKVEKSVKPKKKPEEPVAKQPSALKSRPPHYSSNLLASIIEERLKKPHRSTVRPPHIQFHSPSKASSNREGQSNRDHLPSTTLEDDKPTYFFHPREHQFATPSDKYRYPAHGDLVPVAQSLGKPRQDERLRLPVPSEDEAATFPSRDLDDVARSEVAKPNIGFVEIKADRQEEDETKKTPKLQIQALPSVDIKAFSDPVTKEKGKRLKTPVKLISITPPKQEDYQDFERDIPSGDLNEDINEPKDDQNPEMVLELKGEEDDEPRDYNEPEFPPRHPPCEAEPKGAEIQCRSTIEERATEWLQQELLARMVAQMDIPIDPTMNQFTEQNESDATVDSDAGEEEEEGDWIHEILGPGGVQLCIDAGIPMNRDLMEEIIMEVVCEKVRSLLGHPRREEAPAKEVLPKVDEDSFEGPPNVLTPVRTPEYTPLPSEASVLHTPLSASTATEESYDEGKSLKLQEDEEKSDYVKQDLRTQDAPFYAVKIPTPPQTPDVGGLQPPMTGDIQTPVSSVSEEEGPRKKKKSQVKTPDLSIAGGSMRSLDDFMSTQPEISASLDKHPLRSPAPPQSPPGMPVVQNVKGRSPASMQTRSFTISSSTNFGSSTFEGISEGEKLCPDNVIPGLYSEGEFPLSEGQAVLSQLEVDEEAKNALHKRLLQKVISKKDQEDEDDHISATLKDTEDLCEDTLEEVSISEGQLLVHDDPIAKLLNQIRSPPNPNGGIFGSERDKSEGEISKGEDIKVKAVPRIIARDRHTAGAASLGFASRVLSVGEVAPDNNRNDGNKKIAPSLSLGEVRGLSVSAKNLSSKTEDLSRDERVFDSDNSVGKSTSDAGIEGSPRDTTRIDVEGESLTEQELADHSKDFYETDDTGFAKGPNTILVQSGNFGTASTFNFTDSLDEPRTNVAPEQRIDDVTDDNSLTEQNSDSAEDLLPARISSEKQPTKITLMIPSVADEDSGDDITVEGDDPYSNDDVSNISL